MFISKRLIHRYINLKLKENENTKINLFKGLNDVYAPIIFLEL